MWQLLFIHVQDSKAAKLDVGREDGLFSQLAVAMSFTL